MGDNDIPIRRRGALALSVIVVIAAILRLPDLGYDSLWYDEIWVANSAGTAQSVGDVLRAVEYAKGGAPLHELIVAGWLRFGTSEFMVRFPSFVAGLTTVLLIYMLGRRVFNAEIALLAALLLAFSCFHVRYSQEARYYALFGMLTLCSIITFLRFIDRRTLLRWTMVVISHTLCLYSAYFTAFLIAFEGLYATYLLVRDRVSKTQQRVMTWRTYFALGAAMSLTAVLFLPWYFYGVIREPISGHLHTALDRQWLMSVLRPMTAGSLLSVVVFMVAFVAGLIYCVRSRCHEGVLLALISVSSPFAVLALVNKVGSFFHVRYVLFALPSFLLLVAVGISATAEVLGVLVRRLFGRRLDAVCTWAIALVVFVPLSVFDPADYYENRIADWKRAATYLKGRVAADDIVIRLIKRQKRVCLDYYAGADLSERMYDVVTVAKWYEAGDYSQGSRPLPERLWFVCREMQEADPRLFEVESFGNLYVLCRKKSVESWEDFWALLTDYVCLASSASNEAGRYVFYLLDQELIENGSLSFAYSLCQEITRRYPDKGEFQKELAEMAFRMGDNDVAERAYRAALEIIPDWNRFSRLADILVREQRYDEAEAVVLRAIAARDEPYRRTWLGMIYAASGKHGFAEQQYLKAIAMQPSDEYGHYRLAQLYAKRDRRDEARAEFETVLRLNPSPERVEAVQAQLEKLVARESAAN